MCKVSVFFSINSCWFNIVVDVVESEFYMSGCQVGYTEKREFYSDFQGYGCDQLAECSSRGRY